MDNLQFVLQGERRHSNHPHTHNVHQQEITPKSLETAIKEVHENTEQMRVFDELKSNQFEDSKDGLVGNA